MWKIWKMWKSRIITNNINKNHCINIENGK